MNEQQIQNTALVFGYCVAIVWEAIELFITLFAERLIVTLLLWD